MLSGMAFTPGEGIDFTELGRLILIVLAMYLVAQLFMWLQGRVLNDLVMRLVFRLREDIEAKINRLPLGYFDRSPRGELLSRVTNDIDNITQSMQQTLSQLVNSLLTLIGVLALLATCAGAAWFATRATRREGRAWQGLAAGVP